MIMDKHGCIDVVARFRSKRTLISFAISALALYVLFTMIDADKTIGIVKSADISYFLLALIVYYLSVPVRGYRWKLLLLNVRFKGRLKDVTEIWFLAYFVNCLVPAKLGDIYRGYLVRKNYKIPLSRVLGTIVVERFADIIFLMIMLTLSGYLVFGEFVPQEMLNIIAYGYLLLFAGVVLLVFLNLQKKNIVSFLPSRFRTPFIEFEHGLSNSVTRRDILRIGALTILCWSADILRVYFVVIALGLTMPIPLIVFVAMSVSLLSSLPITPAGLGIVELAMAGVLTYLGFGINVAVSVAILDRVINYWSYIAFGLPVYVLSDKV